MGKVGLRIRALYEEVLKTMVNNKNHTRYENNLSLL